MSPEHRVDRWYAYCRTFVHLPPAMRRAVARQTFAHYRRIARLPRDLGEDLDRRRAPLTTCRWIAWGHSDAARRTRHAAAVAHHTRTDRWPNDRERSALGGGG